MTNIKLRFDSNRPIITNPSKESDQSTEIIPPEQLESKKRVLLIVPPYQRRKKSLDIILENLTNANKKGILPKKNFKEYLQFINQLKKNEITHIIEHKRSGQPHWAMQLGAQLKKKNYNVKILDIQQEGWNNETLFFTAEDGSEIYKWGLNETEIQKYLKKYNPDFIGISCTYTNQIGNALNTATLAKQTLPNTQIILGGYFPSHIPNFSLTKDIDFIIHGQGDLIFSKLINHLTQTGQLTPPTNLRGITYKQYQQTRSHGFAKKLTAQKLEIDYSLIDLKKYSGPINSTGKRKLSNGNLAILFFTRGCGTKKSKSCNFCGIRPMHGTLSCTGKDKLKTTLTELIQNQNVRELIIEDDNLMQNPFHMLDFCNTIEKCKKENNLETLPWFEEGGISGYSLAALLPDFDINKLDETLPGFNEILKARKLGITAEDIIKKMATSGCYGVYFAVESDDSKALTKANKPNYMSNEKSMGTIINLFNKYNIHTTIGLILGIINPNGTYHAQDRQSIQNTIKYGRKLRSYGSKLDNQKHGVEVNPFIFTPLIGAPHFKKLSKITNPNLDITGSHSWCSIDYDKLAEQIGTYPISCSDELDLLRIKAYVESNSPKDSIIKGIQKYKTMCETGTWARN